MTITCALPVFSGWGCQKGLSLKAPTLVVDLWTSIPAVFVNGFIHLFLCRQMNQKHFFFVGLWRAVALFIASIFFFLREGQCSLDWTTSLAVSMLLWKLPEQMDTVCHPWTVRAFRDCGEFVNFQFLHTNSWTAPKAEDGHKPLQLPKKTCIYTFTFCLWSLLCMSNTIFDGATDGFSAACSLYGFFLYVACLQLKTCQNLVEILEMWTQEQKVDQFELT